MAYKLLEKFKTIIGNDPVFTVHAAIAALFMTYPWKRGENPMPTLSIVRSRDNYLSFNEKRYFELATDAFRRYFRGSVSIGELEEQFRSYEGNAQRMYDEVSDRDLSSLPDLELAEHVKRIDALYKELLDTIYIEAIDYDKILSVIGDAHKNDLDGLWEKATESTFVSFEGRYLRDIVEIVSSEQTNAVRKARYMFTDYFWAKSHDEIAAALSETRGTLKEKRQEVEKIYGIARAKKAEHSRWADTLSPEQRRIVDYMQLMMYMRDARKDPIAQMLAMLVEITTIMTSRAGIETKYAPYIALHEYMKGVDYLTGNKKDIEVRDQGCLYLAHPDDTFEIEHCDFEEALAEFHKWTEHTIHDSNELKGQIACRGRVRGTARIISDPQNDKGFQDGDILVTSMTRPEFVPIMKRAGAVVTNEGGITCHAAIVSRELGIPCIIGTKHATRVLHDGDLVEVDADRGVVTIVNKK